MDSLSEFRSFMMRKIRLTVEMVVEQLYLTVEDRKNKISNLLFNMRFTFADLEKGISILLS